MLLVMSVLVVPSSAPVNSCDRSQDAPPGTRQVRGRCSPASTAEGTQGMDSRWQHSVGMVMPSVTQDAGRMCALALEGSQVLEVSPPSRSDQARRAEFSHLQAKSLPLAGDKPSSVHGEQSGDIGQVS